MSGDDGIKMFPAPPKLSSTLASAAPLNQMVAMHNPIQLAAISNYKLAQLTFAPPDLHSMRKTALIKNMLDVLYDDTPPEWLDQMTRWQFFTPESLCDMTQEALEEMFAQYAQTIEAFQPLDMDDDEDDDDDGHSMWADEDDEEEEPTPNKSSSTVSERSIFNQPHATLSSDVISLPSSSAAPSSPESTAPPTPTAPQPPANHSILEKPLPQSPDHDTTRRKSLASSERRKSTSLENKRKSITDSKRASLTMRKSRLSWTSDTGLAPNSYVAQNMANELMNLFDMEFSVDIQLSGAPRLPELPFKQKQQHLTAQQQQQQRRQSKRLSTDSFMGLIPTFESFTLDDDPPFQAAQHLNRKSQQRLSQNRPRQMTFPPPPAVPPPPTTATTTSTSTNALRASKRRSMSYPPLEGYMQAPAPPARSSSLKHRHRHRSSSTGDEQPPSPESLKSKSSDFLASLVNALGPHNDIDTDSPPQGLAKKKSIRRLASFVKGTKKQPQQRGTSQETIIEDPVKEAEQDLLQPPPPRKSLASTLSSSDSWSSEIMVATKAEFNKPLPNAPPSKRRSYHVARPVVIEAQDLRRARSLGHRHPHHRNKRRSSLLMETTASKRRSMQLQHQQQQQQQQQHPSQGSQPVAQPGLSRSKSAFVKIGSGWKKRRQQQKQANHRQSIQLAPAQSTSSRRSVIAAEFREFAQNPSPMPPSTTSLSSSTSSSDYSPQAKPTTFVKRVATLTRKMRLQRV